MGCGVSSHVNVVEPPTNIRVGGPAVLSTTRRTGGHRPLIVPTTCVYGSKITMVRFMIILC